MCGGRGRPEHDRPRFVDQYFQRKAGDGASRVAWRHLHADTRGAYLSAGALGSTIVIGAAAGPMPRSSGRYMSSANGAGTT